MAGSKPAKIASNKSKDNVITFTKRSCEHCGNRIPTKEMSPVLRTKISDSGKINSRMLYFIKGHEHMSLEKAA